MCTLLCEVLCPFGVDVSSVVTVDSLVARGIKVDCWVKIFVVWTLLWLSSVVNWSVVVAVVLRVVVSNGLDVVRRLSVDSLPMNDVIVSRDVSRGNDVVMFGEVNVVETLNIAL